jgi:mediator of RNA polymerase II transcription subunit 24
MEKISKLARQIVQNQFLMGVLYLSKLEDRETYEKCVLGYKQIHSWNKFEVVKDFYQMIFVKLEHMTMKELEPRAAEPISFCLQPFMSIEVLVHSSAPKEVHVAKFLMIQKLKRYSMARLYCEIIRSCFITLCHVKEVNYRVWGAFFLFKVPQILKQLHVQTKNVDDKVDYSDDIVKAFDMLMECTPILDLLDTTFQCNSLQALIMELLKQNLINEENAKRIVEEREISISKLEKFNIPSTPPPINEFVHSIDPTLNGLISSLGDPITPDMLKLLCTLLVDNRAYLLYSVAGVKGKHKTMIKGIMKCNDSCKEILGEAAKSKQAVMFRSNIFDISFILLFSIMQKCGSENFPEMAGDFFFEKWVRDGMVDPTKSKSPMSIVKMCDQSKVDEMIAYFSDTTNQQQPPIAFKWNEICMNIPALLYNILIAWENETIAPAVVKNILDNMRSKMNSYAVVAASWLCAYIKVLRDDEQAKPKVMVQLLMKPLDEGIMTSDTFSEKFSLTQEIIMKLYDSRTIDSPQKKPLSDVFEEQWQEINTSRWLPFDVAMNLEQLYKSCGPFWMMKNLVDQIMKGKFIKEMESTMDIVFAVMHLDIEACTEALLRDILPIMLLNNNQ